jgi:hypothetical protein
MIDLETGLNEEFNRIQYKGSVSSSPTEHIHPNDKNLGRAIETAKEHLDRNEGLLVRPILGMVVGTGGLLSICPELPIDVWLVYDNNSFVLDWVDKAKDATRTAPKLGDYLRILYDENPQANQGYAESGLRREMQSLGKYHLTTDEQRFQRVKQSAKGLSFVRCEGDLANPAFLRESGEILRRRGLSISFVNLSNVYEHAPGVHESLPNLPFREGAVFVWSDRAWNNFLGTHVSVGLDKYLVGAKARYTGYKLEEEHQRMMQNRGR